MVLGQVAGGGLVADGGLPRQQEHRPRSAPRGQPRQQHVVDLALLPAVRLLADADGPAVRMARLQADVGAHPRQQGGQVRRRPGVGGRSADAELGALAEALAGGVMGHDLHVGPALLDQGGQFEEGECVVAVHGGILAAHLAVDHEQTVGPGRQPEERLLAAQRAPPEIRPEEPAEPAAAGGGYHPEHDVAHVVVHARDARASGARGQRQVPRR